MPIRNTLKIAIKAIRRNKVRSGLTMLGVIIGVASVIAMIALGSGARASIDQQIQSQGTNVIYVSAGSSGRGPGAVRGGSGSSHLTSRKPARSPTSPDVARCRPVATGAVVDPQQNGTAEGGTRTHTFAMEPASREELHRPRLIWRTGGRLDRRGEIRSRTRIQSPDRRVRKPPLPRPRCCPQAGPVLRSDDLIVAPYTT